MLIFRWTVLQIGPYTKVENSKSPLPNDLSARYTYRYRPIVSYHVSIDVCICMILDGHVWVIIYMRCIIFKLFRNLQNAFPTDLIKFIKMFLLMNVGWMFILLFQFNFIQINYTVYDCQVGTYIVQSARSLIEECSWMEVG